MLMTILYIKSNCKKRNVSSQSMNSVGLFNVHFQVGDLQCDKTNMYALDLIVDEYDDTSVNAVHRNLKR